MGMKSDAMAAKLSTEIEERSAFIENVVAGALDADRELNEHENEQMGAAKRRIEALEAQLGVITDARSVSTRATRKMDEYDRELANLRGSRHQGEIEYRSAGAYVVDAWAAWRGDRDAIERLMTYNRTAEHQTTADNPGLLPEPVVGPVIEFIDARRPLVNALGVQPLTTSPFRRPRVEQHTKVERQTDGTTDDLTEKVELASQKMIITSDTVNAETYGGYVNVSRQNIDWSSPQVFDLVVADLAKQYAIVTEGVACDALQAVSTTPVEYPLDPDGDEISRAVWTAVGQAYAADPGAMGYLLVVAPDRLASFGPAFAPFGPFNQQGQGFMASMFGQGVMGSISGVPTVMTNGLGNGEAFVLTTSAIELWEQRIGTLSVVEPSVLGVQVAYAGYFATLSVNDDAIVPLEEGTA